MQTPQFHNLREVRGGAKTFYHRGAKTFYHRGAKMYSGEEALEVFKVLTSSRSRNWLVIFNLSLPVQNTVTATSLPALRAMEEIVMQWSKHP